MDRNTRKVLQHKSDIEKQAKQMHYIKHMKKEVDKYKTSLNAISDAIDEIVELESTFNDQKLRLKITIQKLKENWRL